MSRICLGTAQFGMTYGITNSRGRVPPGEVAQILELAAAAGVDSLDTAVVYGASEQTLGGFELTAFRVVTKLPPLPAEETDIEDWVMRHARESCARLQLGRVHGLLLHKAEDATGPRGEALLGALRKAKDEGIASGIGVSIYVPSQLEGLELSQLDLVQAPFSVLDRRLSDSGLLARLVDAKVEVHARSALLQGVLLLDPTSIPDHLAGLRAPVERFRRWADQGGATRVAAAIGHVLSTPGIDRVVLGVDSMDQLRQAIKAEGAGCGVAPRELMVEDPELVNPSRWQ